MRILKSLENINKGKVLAVVYCAVIFAGIFQIYFNENLSAKTVSTFAMPVNKKIIVIDAGHGGWDPGMVGANGVVEKDINLLVAQKLQTFLELAGSVVLVTRDNDEALGDSKRIDLNERRKLSENADIFISIHQNSFPQSSVRGAQAFYYDESPDSKMLAECIQEQVTVFLNRGYTKNRVAKANDVYYLLKKTTSPSVIIECGFLSNPDEGQLLSSDDYQEKIAWTIYMGIVNFFANK